MLVVDVLYSEKAPAGVIFEMALGFVLWWLNQRLPSLPATIWPGWLGMLMLNSVNVMAGPSPFIAPVVPPLPPAPLPPLPPLVVVPLSVPAPASAWPRAPPPLPVAL